MANDNPFLNDNASKTGIAAPVAPAALHHAFDGDANDDAPEEAAIESNGSMPIGAIRGIGRKSDLEDLKARQSMDDDTLMDLLSEDDSDDTSLDYDGDGRDNDLDGEPDGD